jgi:hypothetical protein
LESQGIGIFPLQKLPPGEEAGSPGRGVEKKGRRGGKDGGEGGKATASQVYYPPAYPAGDKIPRLLGRKGAGRTRLDRKGRVGGKAVMPEIYLVPAGGKQSHHLFPRSHGCERRQAES